MLPNVLRGHSEKDRRRINPIISSVVKVSAFDRMKNDNISCNINLQRKAPGKLHLYQQVEQILKTIFANRK